MNILCACDDNYVPYCGIMLTSLLQNNREEEINIYVLTGGLREKKIAELKRLEAKYGCKIEIIKVEEKTFKDCPINPETDHVSIAAYYRLAVGMLLPGDLDRVLYIDCDVIINGSLSELYQTDLTGVACGVIIDESASIDKHYKRLELMYNSKEPYYFNSGILLINLNYWRNNNLDNKCLEYVASNSDKLAFHDQDTLNVVLKGQVTYLPLKFNFQTGMILTLGFASFSSEYKEAINDVVNTGPVILHYTGYNKPWHRGCRHPYVNFWNKYQADSLWKDLRPVGNNPGFKERLVTLRNEIIWRLGLKHRPKNYIV